jgi:magnesium chelatase subunit I
MTRPQTLGELKESGYKIIPVKEEVRKNLLSKLKKKERLFPGLVGYDNTVIVALTNALLAKHNFILLGLRGQAKSRILRSLVDFLDDYIPKVKDCPLHDNPFAPLCKTCQRLLAGRGDDLAVEWLHRSHRYNEKLATPDVSIADLIGDVDPIKAATHKLSLSDEEVIHYGIIPRSNRGIFAINELPDLAPRIQVGLLNLLEEGDLQIRGFPIRLPLDILIAFSANPEDYTNRGNIITPLKDRIDSQILTHYPRTLQEAVQITEQEAWKERDGNAKLHIPHYIKELAEEIAFVARESEFVYQNSGVSARLSISAMENLMSAMEKRSLVNGEQVVYPRMCDLYAVIPSITGKIELVYEGEQEGSHSVARRLIGGAVRRTFEKVFPKATSSPPRGDLKKPEVDSTYKEIIDWFGKGNKLEVSDDMPWPEYCAALKKVPRLHDLSRKHMRSSDDHDIALGMELILEGLHQNSLIAKENLDTKSSYFDMLKVMFDQMKGFYEI